MFKNFLGNNIIQVFLSSRQNFNKIESSALNIGTFKGLELNFVSVSLVLVVVVLVVVLA